MSAGASARRGGPAATITGGESGPHTDPRLPELFAAASEMASAERVAWLAELGRAEPALAREVRELLAASTAPGELLDRSPLPFGAVPAPAAAPDVRPAVPVRVGPYRVLRELGRGGMGRVFLAEQEGDGFRRTVALKLLDAAAATPQAHRRFASEVRILATLEHPGIARFLDGGRSAEGVAFLALEYVEGTDLLAHAAAHGLDVAGRLELFLAVLDAVAYAHERRVVHRDLKPSNVLVGSDGRPRLLDFGISKLADADVEGAPTRTEMRALTPAYASPEQMRGDPVTTASDLYSLGVVLYELLTGARPYRTASGTPRELERAVLEQDPEPPSTAARKAESSRHTTVPAGEIDPDLDAICLKALRKEPAARYASVADFGADLRRYLAGEPVAARRGGWSYRLGRRVRRSRGKLVAAAAVAAALAAGAVAGPWLRHAVAPGPRRAEDSLARVAAEVPMSRASRRQFDAAIEQLRALDPAAALTTLTKLVAADPSSALGWDLVAQAEAALGEPGKASAAALRAHALAASLPADERARLAGRAAAAEQRWEPAIRGFEALLARQPERLDVGLDLVSTDVAAGRTEAALIALGRVRQLAAAADDPRVDLVEAEAALQSGEHQRAAAHAERARRRAAVVGGRVAAVRARVVHGLALRNLDQPADAERELRGALAEAHELGLRRDEAAARLALSSVAGGITQSAATRQEVEAALATYRAVGDARGEVSALCELARQLGMESAMEPAKKRIDEAVALARTSGDLWSLGNALATRLVIANWSGDDDAVMAGMPEALRALRASGNRKQLLTTLGNVSIMKIERLELAEVDTLLDEAQELARQVGSQLQRASVLRARGYLEQERGNWDRSRESYTAAVELARGSGNVRSLANYLSDLAWLEVSDERPAAAGKAAEEAIAAFRRAGDERSAVETMGALAWAEASRGEVAGARRHLAAMRAAIGPPGSANDESKFSWLVAEARVADALGDYETAREHRRETVRMAREWKAPGLLINQQLELADVLVKLHDPGAAPLLRAVLAEAERRDLHEISREARRLLRSASAR
ncbi:MAG TPA: serine/threonine-protein kinase [Thermoanaerobaculia bacterium]|nr:serine/threonine-protein kinase [Thermoanaerobaculia bacterium]